MNTDDKKWSFAAVNDFLINLTGALLPGVVFLFSTIFCILLPAIPTIISITSVPAVTPAVRSPYAWSIGWLGFMIVSIFFILAYAIGNIFYRLDVGEIDGKSFDYKKLYLFNTKIVPLIKNILKIKFEYLSWKAQLKLILFNVKSRLLFETNNYKNSPPFDSKKEFAEKYCQLLIDHLAEINQLAETESEIDDLHKKEEYFLELLKNETIDTLNKIAFYIYKNRGKNIIDVIQNVPLMCSDNQFETRKKRFEASNKREQAKILSGFLRDYINPDILKDYSENPKAHSLDEEKEREISDLLAIGWYFLFSLRSEEACDDISNCLFPYEHYNAYLLKRDDLDLLKHAYWCQNKGTRSKDALNRLKLKIQLIARRDYSILVKNEAHIRMSSSLFYMAKYFCYFVTVPLILILIFFYFHPEGFLEKLFEEKTLILLWISTFLMFFLNSFIYHFIKKFFHHQRMMEIFYVLQVYDEYFGKGCLNEGKRKNDARLLGRMKELGINN